MVGGGSKEEEEELAQEVSKGGNIKVKEKAQRGRMWHKSGGGDTTWQELAQMWGMGHKVEDGGGRGTKVDEGPEYIYEEEVSRKWGGRWHKSGRGSRRRVKLAPKWRTWWNTP